MSQQPLFHRSISCDNNLFNNKTGFSQSHPAIPPPVAQVAPLRGIPVTETTRTVDSNSHENPNSLPNGASITNNNGTAGCYESFMSYNSSSRDSSTTQQDINRSSLKQRSSSLNQKSEYNMHNNQASPQPVNYDEMKSICNGTDAMFSNKTTKKQIATMTEAIPHCNGNASIESANPLQNPQQQSVMVMISPLRYESENVNNENRRNCSPSKDSKENNMHFVTNINDSKSSWIKNKSEVSFRMSCTSDAYSQTESSGNEDDKDEDDSALPTEPNSLSLTLSSTSSSVSSSCNDVTTTTITKCGLNSPSPTTSLSSYKARQKSQEELECEELSRDLAKQLPQGDKLQSLLGK